ncbi:MAG: hypothetical protein J6K43_01625 [Lachnospiraceae bacterium]|nr:hypothetical protein [Lachnospiraceae bacterium]
MEDTNMINSAAYWEDHRSCNGHIKDIWCPFCKDVQKMVEYHPTKAICTLGEIAV